MVKKIKALLDVFGKVALGVMFAAAIYISIFVGTKAQISSGILWQVLIVSAVCSLPALLYSTDSEKELSKKGMLLLNLFYFAFVNVAVLGLGNLFEWLSFKNPRMIVVMELLIIAVYALVNVVCYLKDRATAQNMNEKLKEWKK